MNVSIVCMDQPMPLAPHHHLTLLPKLIINFVNNNSIVLHWMPHRHHLESTKFPSERINDALKREACIIGIDEAGRGPVLGPLVYGIFICPISHQSWLKENGANDSKLLSIESREEFFQTLLRPSENLPCLGWRTKVLHPEHISNCMLRREKFNLNELSYATVFDLIHSLLNDGIIIREAYVDTLGKPAKYEERLTAKFPTIKFTVRSKADSLFPVVGAASIVAKVIRDDILRGLGIEASGYPGDPFTVSWLKESVHHVFGFPRVVRFSWSSCNSLLEEKCAPIKWIDAELNQSNKENSIRKRSKMTDEPDDLSSYRVNSFGMTNKIFI